MMSIHRTESFFYVILFYRIGYYSGLCHWSALVSLAAFYTIFWSNFPENNETKQAATLDNFEWVRKMVWLLLTINNAPNREPTKFITKLFSFAFCNFVIFHGIPFEWWKWFRHLFQTLWEFSFYLATLEFERI